MKIHLSISSNAISNYLNLSPIKPDLSLGQNWVCWSEFGNLSQFCEAGEAWEILAPDIIDYLKISDIAPLIEYWSKLLRHGGKIILGGTDLSQLSRETYLGNVSVLDYNNMVYGNVARKSSINHMIGIVELLKSFGLKINKQRINSVSFIVEAERQ